METLGLRRLGPHTVLSSLYLTSVVWLNTQTVSAALHWDEEIKLDFHFWMNCSFNISADQCRFKNSLRANHVWQPLTTAAINWLNEGPLLLISTLVLTGRKQTGAVEACRAQNPDGSEPSSVRTMSQINEELLLCLEIRIRRSSRF